MKPVDQTKMHAPPHSKGNCLAACIASIMELSIDEVPALEELRSDVWWGYLWYWLELRGWGLEDHWRDTGGDNCTGAILTPPEDEFYIAGGPSPRGDFGHVVVMKGSRLIHDPNPHGGGLAGQMTHWYRLMPPE